MLKNSQKNVKSWKTTILTIIYRKGRGYVPVTPPIHFSYNSYTLIYRKKFNRTHIQIKYGKYKILLTYRNLRSQYSFHSYCDLTAKLFVPHSSDGLQYFNTFNNNNHRQGRNEVTELGCVRYEVANFVPNLLTIFPKYCKIRKSSFDELGSELKQKSTH